MTLPRVRGTVPPRPIEGMCPLRETMRRTSPSFCRIAVSYESQRVAADSTSVSRTLGKSNAARLMTLSTSAVAVCCCSDWAHLLTVDSDPSDQIIVLEHGYAEQRACAGHICKFEGGWMTVEIGLVRCNV